MNLQEIEVIIDPDGKVRIEVHGVKGMQCLNLTKDLEAALGDAVEEREMKPEAYEAVEETQDQLWLGKE